jgi:hypothetical protein
MLLKRKRCLKKDREVFIEISLLQKIELTSINVKVLVNYFNSLKIDLKVELLHTDMLT